MPLSGTFATMPFVDLLQWLGDTRRDGTLAVALEFEERYLRFERGQIVAYGSDDPMARDLGRICLQASLIAESKLLEAIESQTRSHMPLGDVLVAQGYVDADALTRAVRKHVEETVLGLFLWPDGRFTFSEPQPVPPPEENDWIPPEFSLEDPLDVREVLMEGMRRLDEWNRIVKVLPTDDVQLHALGPAEDLPILEYIAARPEQPSLGALLAERNDSRYAICEQLVRAFERGLLAIESAEPAPLTDTNRGATTVEHLVRAARSLASEGQHEEAAGLLRSAVGIDPFRADARVLLRKVSAQQLADLYTTIPREFVPELVPRSARDTTLPLQPRERRLLAHINGRWDVGALALTTALGELETLRALRRLLHAGMVKLSPPPRSRH
jgi:Domain of unknown function (DUF4388)